MIRLAIFLCLVASSHALTCSPCHTVRCRAPENCPRGTVKGVCGCCDVCAKVEGEECGGPWNVAGVCAEGLICNQRDHNSHGTCQKESTPPDCGENAHFDGCGKGACQPTCDNPTPICTMQCIPSCQCDKGFVLHDGKCIPDDQCPDRKCPENSHFRQCGTCERTCQNPNPICTRECKPARCHCDTGYVLEGESCIPTSQCNGCTVEGDDYYPNGAKWASETKGTNCMCVDKKEFCTPIDKAQCPLHSSVELAWGDQYPLWTCVVESHEKTACQRQLDSPDPETFVRQCAEDGTFQTTQTDPNIGARYCAHPLHGTIYKETEKGPKDKMDVDCQTYWQTNHCGENAHFNTCGMRTADVPRDTFGMCQPSCENPSPVCPEICVPSCQCDEGFLLHEGRCIPPDKCPDRKCPKHSHFESCGNGPCRPTCEQPKGGTICPAACFADCYCDLGFVLGKEGCVPVHQCGGCTVDGDQYYPNGAKWASKKVGVNCMCLRKKVFCAPIDKTHCPAYSRIETSTAGNHILWTCIKETTTKCERERELALKSGMMDAFMKQCDDDGSFLPLQCYGFTGECYCAHPHTGVLYEETRAMGKPGPDCNTYWKSQGGKTAPEPKTKCELERDSAPLRLGAFVKQCDDQGRYRVVQCHGSTGYCFCANPKDGSIFEETGRRGEPGEDCNKYWEEHGTKTKCQQERDDAVADLASGMVGKFVKTCAKDGSYHTRQCHASTGYCYCAHPAEGTVYWETGVRPWEAEGAGHDCDNYWRTKDEQSTKDEL